MFKTYIVSAIGALSCLAIGSADAAVRWEIEGVKGEACYASTAAWALYKAAQEEGGIINAIVMRVPEDDAFAKQCAAERQASRSSSNSAPSE